MNTITANGTAHATVPRWTPSAVRASEWVLALERPFPLVLAAVQSLRREKVLLRQAEGSRTNLVTWARALAEEVAAEQSAGVVFFCGDPGLVVCVANKVEPIRAVAVQTVGQAALAGLSLRPNFVAVEMPGRTYYESLQILRTFATTQPVCPQELVALLDSHGGCTCASAK